MKQEGCHSTCLPPAPSTTHPGPAGRGCPAQLPAGLAFSFHSSHHKALSVHLHLLPLCRHPARPPLPRFLKPPGPVLMASQWCPGVLRKHPDDTQWPPVAPWPALSPCPSSHLSHLADRALDSIPCACGPLPHPRQRDSSGPQSSFISPEKLSGFPLGWAGDSSCQYPQAPAVPQGVLPSTRSPAPAGPSLAWLSLWPWCPEGWTHQWLVTA